MPNDNPMILLKIEKAFTFLFVEYISKSLISIEKIGIA